MATHDLNISLVITAIQEEAKGYYSIFFERPRNFLYNAGDWMDIRFPTPEFPVGKTYSIASSPTEDRLQIGFKAGVSLFKKALIQVQPNDRMLITQYGGNDFQLHKQFNTTLIAGGIGITPYRSMLKELVDENRPMRLRLIYLHQGMDFPYKAELDTIGTSELRRKDRDKLLVDKLIDATGLFYIAGPPAMVASTHKTLILLGIHSKFITTDSFEGY
jgi:ferredoxin-NADP reductase